MDSETPLRRGLVTEPIFYRDVAATLGVRVPPCEYTGIDDATGTGIVVMRDLVVAGAVFGDPCDSYTPERSAAVLGELARLHAATWGRSPASLPRQLQPSLRSLTKVVGPELLSELLVDGRADTLPAAVTDGHRLHAAMHAMAALDADTQCLVHGDLHTGNLYTLPDGSPGLIDWQVVQLGHFALDIGYHLATALEPSVRAQYERDLLDHYLDRLASHCVTPPTREDAWLAYRSRLAYGFFMWGITRFQPRVVIEHFVHRLGQAVSEHNSLDLLGV